MSASTSNLPPLPSPNPPRRGAAAAWKNEVSARVRAHRNGQRPMPQDQPALPGMETTAPSAVAARVADRYARIPSWREAMAAEAAAQTAAQTAAAAPPPPKPAAPRRAKSAAARPAAAAVPALDFSPDPQPEAGAPESRVPYQPALIRYSVAADSLPAPRFTPAEARVHAAAAASAVAGIDISDPLEEAIVEPTRLLPARVIEFPRELVAPRKARPRYAEGPLTGETSAPKSSLSEAAAGLLSAAADLRIFEAEPETAALPKTKAATPRQSMPEWQSIRLDNEAPVREPKAAARPSFSDDGPFHVAPVADRFMSGVVDVGLTFAAFLAFVLVFAACSTHLPSGKPALVVAGIVLLSMWLLYQFLFFSLSAATPGMRYAKIALCTFDDENPTRRAMRSRIAALMLSALPLGLGFLWAIFDEDALCWHDRITQTYQRSYREL